MGEFKGSSDYSVIVFGEQGFMIKMQYVNDLHSLIRWLNQSKFKDWTTLNVYARRSGRFIRQYKRYEYIDRLPK